MQIIVPPSGPTNSPPIAIVGEAPGKEEEIQGLPFVGASGHLLTQMLSAAGIPRGDCYITNVSKIRPPGNDFRKMYYEDPTSRDPSPTPALCSARESLWAELKRVNPKVVVALGVEALKALAMTSEMSKYRGTMIESFGLRVLPTYHPAYILRVYDERPIVETDLKKAYRQAFNPYIPQTYLQPTPSFGEVIDFLRTRPKRLTLDIETINLTTRCIGFGWSKYEAISIPLASRGSSHWTLDQESQILHSLNQLFLSPDVEFVLQNGPFDLTILAREFGFQIRNYVLDTMFAHHLLYPELPKGLDFLSSVYTDHPMYWGYDSRNDRSTATYNCMDCIVTFEAGTEIEDELKSRNLWDYYRTIVHPAVSALTRVQSRGVLIDETARQEISISTTKELEELQTKINVLVGHELNVNSPKQVSELVYDKWGLPPQFKPRTKTRTADEDALRILSRRTKDLRQQEILKTIIAARQKRVLLGTFVDMKLKNGRVHTSYSLAGTVTGRIASSQTIDGYGGNLQNIPRGAFRRIFRADPGKLLVKADLSQAEYRVLIWKARIRRIIDRFLNDPKFSIHMWNAAENIYRIPYAEVTKKMYDEAKNGVYGSNYGIGAIKVSRMYNIDLAAAKFIIFRYHEAVPEIQGVYQKEIRDEVIQTRTIRNPFGRERIFFGRMDDDLYRKAYSHYCQSTVADLILAGLVDLDAAGHEVLLQVHDELVLQFPEDKVLEGVATVRRAMERPIKFPGVEEPLVIPCEVKIGPDWYNMKPLAEFQKGSGTA